MKIVTTGDGSQTVLSGDENLSFHSRFGALTESRVIFIESGLKPLAARLSVVDVLEIGFGTGLNAYLTLLETEGKTTVSYYAVEAQPLGAEIYNDLAYAKLLDHSNDHFLSLHTCAWEEKVKITPAFELFKHHSKAETCVFPACDLVYFDAFGPEDQPELWTVPVFKRLYEALRPGGCLVTFSVKGSVRRNLAAAGFTVEKLPGPPFKKEICRAVKPGGSGKAL